MFYRIIFMTFCFKIKGLMNLKASTSSVAIHAIIHLLKDRNIPCDEISAETGIDSALFGIPDVRITVQQMNSLWDYAIKITGDPALALHIRKKYGKDIRHFVISIAKNSYNLLEAARYWCRYARLICETDRIDLRDDGENTKIVFTSIYPEYQSVCMLEHDLSMAVEYARTFTENNLNPVTVCFMHSKPQYSSEYDKAFNCPVLFEQEENSIVLRKKDLMNKIVSRDPHLHAILKKHAESVMKQVSESDTVRGKVEEFIIKKLPVGIVDIESAAFYMNMSRSTLHRKLKNEGITFSKILENMRKQLAETYLRQGMSSTQIAFLLGFSEPSTFQHAFKRWFGTTPGERRRLL